MLLLLQATGAQAGCSASLSVATRSSNAARLLAAAGARGLRCAVLRGRRERGCWRAESNAMRCNERVTRLLLAVRVLSALLPAPGVACSPSSPLHSTHRHEDTNAPHVSREWSALASRAVAFDCKQADRTRSLRPGRPRTRTRSWMLSIATRRAQARGEISRTLKQCMTAQHGSQQLTGSRTPRVPGELPRVKR